MTGSRTPSDLGDLHTTAQRGRKPHGNAPQRIGERYEVLEQLGRGGMASVYRVRDLGDGRTLGLKQLSMSPSSSRAEEITALFQREFQTLAQLSHPSVIEVYDYGMDARGPYYTMELLDGGDLTEHTPLPYVRACELLLPVCSSLGLLHSRRWVHRDITPRNVRCTSSGHAKLIDFGAMVPMGACVTSIGTPAFTAPEVLRELPLDGRTDLFSLGATLYYCLTGQPAWAVRSFAELREAWSSEPPPPSALAPDIPEALDALVLSLLRIDPASRPRSAFEVMQRLAAIAGVSEPESLHVSQAYLSAPTLVGRDGELQLCRDMVLDALAAHGGGLLFQGQAGIGRSRLLQACVLEAKTCGATVLHLAGRTNASTAFSGARTIASELVRALPCVAAEHAKDLIALAPWLSTGASSPPGISSDPGALQSAMLTWLARICEQHTLVIAVDDVELLDDASLGLLLGLLREAPRLRALLLATTRSDLAPADAPALPLLRADCTLATLLPLTHDQSEQLFTSVFGNAPHVALLCDRVHTLSAGNPREAMALAQYMLDVKIVRYTDGAWSLPAELSLRELPNDPGDRVRVRLAGLPALARQLLEAHAISRSAALKRAHHAQLAPEASPRQLREAIDTLLLEGLLISEAGAFTLAHAGLADWLASQLTEAERVARHAALARAWQRTGHAGLHDVYHLLVAGEAGPALERLHQQLEERPIPQDFQHAAGMPVKDLAEVLTRAHAAALAQHARPRITSEIARQLTALSLVTDNKLHARYAPGWLAQLEQDTGLRDFRALPAELGSERLQRALGAAIARYQDQPEQERVYGLEEAVRNLCWYVTLSIAISARTRELPLMASLAPLLEPFVSLSPIIAALWQNAIAAHEMNFEGQSGRAHARSLEVFERLTALRTQEYPYLDTVRNAIAFSLAGIELGLGYESSSRWLELLQDDPLQRVNVLYLRRLLCIHRGDAEGAEEYRRQAELASLQASARQMFAMPLRRELMAQMHQGDLAAVKHVADQIAEIAAAEPGWIPLHDFALGSYQRLRGDHEAARSAFEEAISAADAMKDRTLWVASAAGHLGVLVELERAPEARALGIAALARCKALAIDEDSDLRRELALAEARCGDFAAATARIEALMAERADRVETHRVLDYEARARIALWAGDPAAGEHLAKAAALQLSFGRGSAFLRRYPRLLEDARRAGVQVALSLTAFETSVLHATPAREPSPDVVQARSALAALPSLAERAQWAVSFLALTTMARSARLYLEEQGELVHVGSWNIADASALDAYVAERWQQLGMNDELSTASTGQHTTSATWTDRDGTRYRLLLLPMPAADGFRGVCALGEAQARISDTERDLAREISAALR